MKTYCAKSAAALIAGRRSLRQDSGARAKSRARGWNATLSGSVSCASRGGRHACCGSRCGRRGGHLLSLREQRARATQGRLISSAAICLLRSSVSSPAPYPLCAPWHSPSLLPAATFRHSAPNRRGSQAVSRKRHRAIRRPDGQQIVNTVRAVGDVASGQPGRHHPPADKAALEREAHVVSGVYFGTGSRQPFVALNLPVTAQGAPYMLNIALPTRSILRLISSQAMIPHDWLLSW